MKVIICLHAAAVLILIGGPLWALHPALGAVGIVAGLVGVAEIHGLLQPALDWIKRARVAP